MYLKRVFTKKENLSLSTEEKKFFNNTLYEKFFLRAKLSQNSDIGIVDNNSSFFNFSKSDLNVEKGNSVQVNSIVFSDNLTNLINFESLNLNNKPKFDPFLFLKKYGYFRSKRSQQTLYVEKAVKGGFIAHSGNFFGFLPRWQSKKALYGPVKPLLNSSNTSNNISFLLNKKNFMRRFFNFPISHVLGKTSVRTAKDRRKSRRKGIKFTVFLNTVFLFDYKKLKKRKKRHEK